MHFPIIIFFIAIIVVFTMLCFRAWEIRTQRVKIPEDVESTLPDLTFRHIEKNMLYLTKHILQSILLFIVRYWFIASTKTRKWIAEKMPRVYKYFKKKPLEQASFMRRAIYESKVKIKRVRDRVKQEHEEEKDIAGSDEGITKI